MPEVVVKIRGRQKIVRGDLFDQISQIFERLRQPKYLERHPGMLRRSGTGAGRRFPKYRGKTLVEVSTRFLAGQGGSRIRLVPLDQRPHPSTELRAGLSRLFLRNEEGAGNESHA